MNYMRYKDRYEILKKLIAEASKHYDDVLSQIDPDSTDDYLLGELTGRISILARLKLNITMLDNKEFK